MLKKLPGIDDMNTTPRTCDLSDFENCDSLENDQKRVRAILRKMPGMQDPIEGRSIKAADVAYEIASTVVSIIYYDIHDITVETRRALVTAFSEMIDSDSIAAIQRLLAPFAEGEALEERTEIVFGIAIKTAPQMFPNIYYNDRETSVLGVPVYIAKHIRNSKGPNTLPGRLPREMAGNFSCRIRPGQSFTPFGERLAYQASDLVINDNGTEDIIPLGCSIQTFGDAELVVLAQYIKERLAA
ncbi:hypothetical protein [uncultured Salinicola sp.]|uniref:hypothetical protein n=1 Tax=uncultured Salinicola sp. TaxID=1193542 RepID=UPI00260FBEA5|nr:hypothetical protein [uncultured Salinicola sp.]|tara:strand:+ start:2992 stop:3717 length:726 start_codon:yes stop_codon:yes gene_type:complete